jgi:exopolysaccharide production protein ExoZ
MSVTVAELPSAAVSRVRARASQKLTHLQALRGVAASLVVLAHSVLALSSRDLMSRDLADRISGAGYFGVAAFFVISGFIIFKTSRRSFGNLPGATEFVLKRLIRIFPLYWLATALFYVLSPHRGGFTAADLMFSILLIPHAVADAADLHPLVAQGWTLQYEMLFYGLFTLGLFLSRRAGTLAIVAMLVGLVVVGNQILPLSATAEPMTVLQYWTRPIILLFAVGIGFGVLSEELEGRFTVPAPFLGILAVIAAWIAYSVLTPQSTMDQLRFPMVVGVWVLCALCVALSVFGRSGEGRLEIAAEAFGDASYSVYLFHTFVLSALLRLGIERFSPALFVVAALVGANVFGLLMFAFVEKPVLKLLRRTLLPRASA